MLINSIDANRRQEATFLAYPDPPPENFGKRLKRLAKEMGLSNKALAQETGAHEVTVSRWMGGQEPKGATLLSLAAVLKVTPDYLLKGEKPANPQLVAIETIEEGTQPVVEVRPPKKPQKKRRVRGSRPQRQSARPPAPQGRRK